MTFSADDFFYKVQTSCEAADETTCIAADDFFKVLVLVTAMSEIRIERPGTSSDRNCSPIERGITRHSTSKSPKSQDICKL